MAGELSVGAAASRKQKSGTATIVLAALFVASLGAAVWFWQRAATEHTASGDSRIRSTLHLESFVVNLSGASENGYLRVGIDLGLGTEPKEAEKRAASIGRMRDAILAVLGTRSVEELLTPAGKTKLKQDLLAAINERVPEVDCLEIYFTEFLVQR